MSKSLRAQSLIVLMAAVACGPQLDATAGSGWSDGAPWTLGDRLLVIGGTDTLPGHALFRVRSAVRTSEGSIVIADGSTNEVRVFDASGALVSRFGGSGRGPEEFAGLAGVYALAGDTIMTFDRTTYRLGYWSTDGTPLGSVSLPLDIRPNLIGRLEDGSFIGLVPMPSRPEGEMYMDSMALFRVTADGQSRSRIGTFPRMTMFAGPSLTRPRPLYQGLPFAPLGTAATGHSITYVGYGDSWEILRFGSDGRPLESLRRSLARRPFTPEMKGLWIDDLATRVPPDEEPELRQFYSVFPMPDSLPTYDRLLVDDLEFLWVRERLEPGAEVYTWSVFSPDGTWLGEVDLPRDLQPLQIGADFVVALVPGADDVEQVIVFALDRQGG